jgi:hypothetical protein
VRQIGRPFPPGVSGNPGGRPRGLVSAIRSETRDGAELVQFMLSVLRGEIGGATLRDRVAAASWLADHGFGRAPQALAVLAGRVEPGSQPDPAQLVAALDRMSDGALLELEEALRSLQEKPGPPALAR